MKNIRFFFSEKLKTFNFGDKIFSIFEQACYRNDIFFFPIDLHAQGFQANVIAGK